MALSMQDSTTGVHQPHTPARQGTATPLQPSSQQYHASTKSSAQAVTSVTSTQDVTSDLVVTSDLDVTSDLAVTSDLDVTSDLAATSDPAATSARDIKAAEIVSSHRVSLQSDNEVSPTLTTSIVQPRSHGDIVSSSADVGATCDSYVSDCVRSGSNDNRNTSSPDEGICATDQVYVHLTNSSTPDRGENKEEGDGGTQQNDTNDLQSINSTRQYSGDSDNGGNGATENNTQPIASTRLYYEDSDNEGIGNGATDNGNNTQPIASTRLYHGDSDNGGDGATENRNNTQLTDSTRQNYEDSNDEGDGATGNTNDTQPTDSTRLYYGDSNNEDNDATENSNNTQPTDSTRLNYGDSDNDGNGASGNTNNTQLTETTGPDCGNNEDEGNVAANQDYTNNAPPPDITRQDCGDSDDEERVLASPACRRLPAKYTKWCPTCGRIPTRAVRLQRYQDMQRWNEFNFSGRTPNRSELLWSRLPPKKQPVAVCRSAIGSPLCTGCHFPLPASPLCASTPPPSQAYFSFSPTQNSPPPLKRHVKQRVLDEPQLKYLLDHMHTKKQKESKMRHRQRNVEVPKPTGVTICQHIPNSSNCTDEDMVDGTHQQSQSDSVDTRQKTDSVSDKSQQLDTPECHLVETVPPDSNQQKKINLKSRKRSITKCFRRLLPVEESIAEKPNTYTHKKQKASSKEKKPKKKLSCICM